ncbi:aldo/keto reductase, partial [Paenibacillus sepulcri]|nr:aldo/keto reductase [Paenibacillus sepulcri]
SKGRGLVGKFWPVLEDSVIRDITRISWEGGINWFDTAEAYGGGQSEEMLADALSALGDAGKGAHVATKWWPAMRTAGNIGKTIDERLRRLKGWTIDLYQVHQPYSFSSASSEMNAMAKLVE